ncbi:MAG: hydrogenase maturation nickel metallochaperone HypA [Clostridiales bacterium]|nr:hydrogenase maturation nickel metallochaperone HypA [Clostridiales bacterium]
MHELSLIASLFEILEEKARDERAKKIVLVKLKVGKLAGAVPEFLETAFNIYKDGTIAREAILEIEEVPLKIRCRKCQAIAERDDFVFVCPACGSTDLETLEGTELLLEKMDLEV